MLTKIKKLSALVIILLAFATMLPESDNYYQIAIDLVAADHGLQPDDLQMQSGSYQNLLLFKTVQVNLLTSNAQSIQVVIKQVPLFDWYIGHFAILENN